LDEEKDKICVKYAGLDQENSLRWVVKGTAMLSTKSVINMI
jgi:hypothetical protein